MKEEEKGTQVKRKAFKEKAIWIGTFLGGPLVAGYLLSENFKTFNQTDKVKPTWIITIITTILIFILAFLIPENINIPNQLFPIAYSVIAYGLYKKYQEKDFDTFIKHGGLTHNWWKVIGISLISLLITVLSLFAIIFVSDSIQQENISTKTYGLVAKHEIDFNRENISEIEVDKIADGLRETGFFDMSVPKYVFVKKTENKYEISISVINGIENDNEALKHFVDLRKQLDSFFPNKKIEIKLTVDYLDNVVKTLK